MHPVLGKVVGFFAPEAKKADDGRDMWPSRISFIFASMGGAIGLGNLLRYPSVVYASGAGLAWFPPYLIALFLIAIPALILEISLGQCYRGGTVVAFDHVGKRLKGVGLAIMLNGYFVVVYYVPIIAWIMKYFQHSFHSPLAWTGRVTEFFTDDIVDNVDAIPAVYSDSGSVEKYAEYPDTSMVGTTVAWLVFTWFVVWLCMFKGVGLTGRAVYFTIGIPIVTVIILIGSAASLDNAIDGVRMYMGQWHGGKLASGDIWQAAAGQIFFSIGVGFGYFTSYASYNAKYSNAVQDALIISCSNSFFEVVAAFAVFSVIGNLGLDPNDEGDSLSTFTVAFLTYPEAIINMPGSNWWAILFFATLFLLGLSSAFALLETLVTLCVDTEWGKKVPRTLICTGWVIISFLLSLMYATRFGLDLLDAVDTYVNNCSLLAVVWLEAMCATALYRHKDVWSECGVLSWALFNFAHAGGQVIGVAVGHGVDPKIGAGVGFGIFVAFTIASVLVAKTPTAPTPSFWGKNAFISRFWWLAFYSGNQLTRDLNVVVGQGRNWRIPVFWAPLLRYITSPVLMIIYGFIYQTFHENRGNPLHVFGIAIAHWIIFMAVIGIIFPRWYDFLIPDMQKGSEKLQYTTSPGVTLDDTPAREREHQDAMDMEVGLDRSSDGQEKKL